MGSSGPGRVRVERGVYRQPNGKYAVCWRHAGKLRFRTVGFDLAEARRERLALTLLIPRPATAGSSSLSVGERFEHGAADVLVDDGGVDVGDLGAFGETVDDERV